MLDDIVDSIERDHLAAANIYVRGKIIQLNERGALRATPRDAPIVADGPYVYRMHVSHVAKFARLVSSSVHPGHFVSFRERAPSRWLVTDGKVQWITPGGELRLTMDAPILLGGDAYVTTIDPIWLEEFVTTCSPT